jgi:hypothetical protein
MSGHWHANLNMPGDDGWWRGTSAWIMCNSEEIGTCVFGRLGSMLKDIAE